MRVRPSARVLIIDPDSRVLLFRFAHHGDALNGRSYWATPGGGLEQGESFERAAIRELFEETGIVRQEVGPCVAQQRFSMLLPSGEQVMADEHFFIVTAAGGEITDAHWSEHEKSVISRYRWWSVAELQHASETVYPTGLATILSAPATQWPLQL
ncbi:NUDIX domain-containing protein [Affinibrenneria salicis]|uniref:NUDIX domain-containing protein n=1 Tax=Affinibrenneria salicis TaxID=2590031 RepID=A0A5J5FST1_9GAMM|nr:NUDIX domain-containing protein [Affinibrenneria salicis]KAA8996078.1 NUDIX domain-containing protein [Affinibrenneria salicis]